MYGGMKSNFCEESLNDTKYLVSKPIFKNNTYVDQPYCILKEKIEVQGFDINKNYIWNKQHSNQQNSKKKSVTDAQEVGQILQSEESAAVNDERPPTKRQKSLKHLSNTASMAACTAWKF